MSIRRLSISLPEFLVDDIDEICDENMISRSAFFKAAVRYYLKYINEEDEEE